MTLIKIGGTYVNMEMVTEVRDTGIDVEIFFNTEKATILRGSEAETFRRWLESTAVDPSQTPGSRS